MINEKQFVLKSGIIHNFGNLTIEKDCTLTASKWTSKHPKHAVLIICCGTLTIKKGPSINVNRKGIPGGKTVHINIKINDNNSNSLESDCTQGGRYGRSNARSRSSNTNNSIDSYSFLNHDSNSNFNSRKHVKISC